MQSSTKSGSEVAEFDGRLLRAQSQLFNISIAPEDAEAQSITNTQASPVQTEEIAAEPLSSLTDVLSLQSRASPGPRPRSPSTASSSPALRRLSTSLSRALSMDRPKHSRSAKADETPRYSYRKDPVLIIDARPIHELDVDGVFEARCAIEQFDAAGIGWLIEDDAIALVREFSQLVQVSTNVCQVALDFLLDHVVSEPAPEAPGHRRVLKDTQLRVLAALSVFSSELRAAEQAELMELTRMEANEEVPADAPARRRFKELQRLRSTVERRRSERESAFRLAASKVVSDQTARANYAAYEAAGAMLPCVDAAVQLYDAQIDGTTLDSLLSKYQAREHERHEAREAACREAEDMIVNAAQRAQADQLAARKAALRDLYAKPAGPSARSLPHVLSFNERSGSPRSMRLPTS
eukprot:TRINITY_DN33_c0_g1_i1.p1 TRINITY_DN33_c0_g1~~TRINITY_DN33_c0_g1_i1.p1  ORF type:complete len:409 (+),score=61.07 TRINITY_DN33_c0_g1_i1:115-1341(+)